MTLQLCSSASHKSSSTTAYISHCATGRNTARGCCCCWWLLLPRACLFCPLALLFGKASWLELSPASTSRLLKAYWSSATHPNTNGEHLQQHSCGPASCPEGCTAMSAIALQAPAHCMCIVTVHVAQHRLARADCCIILLPSCCCSSCYPARGLYAVLCCAVSCIAVQAHDSA